MSNELLKEILGELKSVNQRLSNLEEGQAQTNKKLDVVYDQVANLTEFKTNSTVKLEIISDDIKSLQTDMDVVVVNAAKNTADIVKLKKVR